MTHYKEELIELEMYYKSLSKQTHVILVLGLWIPYISDNPDLDIVDSMNMFYFQEATWMKLKKWVSTMQQMLILGSKF